MSSKTLSASKIDLWYDGEAHGDASDHVRDEPLHGVLGQPCQDRDSAFHLFKDKDRLYHPANIYLILLTSFPILPATRTGGSGSGGRE